MYTYSGAALMRLCARDEGGEESVCRICLEPAPDGVAPCECSGTCRLVHVQCLERWVVERGSCHCEVCKAPYAQHSLTALGRRRIAEAERIRFQEEFAALELDYAQPALQPPRGGSCLPRGSRCSA